LAPAATTAGPPFLKRKGEIGQGAVWGLRRQHGRYLHRSRIVRGALHAREVLYSSWPLRLERNGNDTARLIRSFFYL
jgi:hypothetical protein